MLYFASDARAAGGCGPWDRTKAGLVTFLFFGLFPRKLPSGPKFFVLPLCLCPASDFGEDEEEY